MIIGNPTARAKAVRIAGGHVIIESGKTETLDNPLSEADVARYKAVGLTFPTARQKLTRRRHSPPCQLAKNNHRAGCHGPPIHWSVT